MSKVQLNENQIAQIVYNSVKSILKEGLFNRTYREGKPKNAAEVINGNGWKGYIVDRNPNELVIRVYKNSDSILSSFDDVLPFEELVEDLNIYYEDKGAKCRAYGSEEYNGEQGAFITIRK